MLTRIAEAVAPGGRLVRSSTFPGGLSSEIVLVEAELGDGFRRRLVVRRARGDRGSIPMGVELSVWDLAAARRPAGKLRPLGR